MGGGRTCAGWRRAVEGGARGAGRLATRARGLGSALSPHAHHATVCRTGVLLVCCGEDVISLRCVHLPARGLYEWGFSSVSAGPGGSACSDRNLRQQGARGVRACSRVHPCYAHGQPALHGSPIRLASRAWLGGRAGHRGPRRSEN